MRRVPGCATCRALSTPQAHQPPVLGAPQLHGTSRRPRFSSDPGGKTSSPLLPSPPPSELCRVVALTAAHAIGSGKIGSLLFLLIFLSKCRVFPRWPCSPLGTWIFQLLLLSWKGPSRPEAASSEEVSQPPKGSLPLGDSYISGLAAEKGEEDHSDTEPRQHGGSGAAGRDVVPHGTAVEAPVIAQVRDQAANPTPQLPKLSARPCRDPPRAQLGWRNRAELGGKSPAVRR